MGANISRYIQDKSLLDTNTCEYVKRIHLY